MPILTFPNFLVRDMHVHRGVVDDGGYLTLKDVVLSGEMKPGSIPGQRCPDYQRPERNHLSIASIVF